jgi:hypothetical protein
VLLAIFRVLDRALEGFGGSGTPGAAAEGPFGFFFAFGGIVGGWENEL